MMSFDVKSIIEEICGERTVHEFQRLMIIYIIRGDTNSGDEKHVVRTLYDS